MKKQLLVQAMATVSSPCIRSKDFLLQREECWLERTQYENGRDRLILQPWSIEITLGKVFVEKGNTALRLYKNFPSMLTILTNCGLVQEEAIGSYRDADGAQHDYYEVRVLF